MLENLMTGVYDNAITSSVNIWQLLTVMGASLALGLIIAMTYMYRTRFTKSFVITLALLPAIICMIILMVNGSVGTGVAVAGAFSLVRFRSVPGTAREICMIFLAMATGLITGMGYLAIAAIFTILICMVFMIYSRLDLGARTNANRYRTFRVTIPEDLDYTGVFEDVFSEYTSACDLTGVKTINMGSMFRITYDVILKDPSREKELIDKLRCRNGNLEINVSSQSTIAAEL